MVVSSYFTKNIGLALGITSIGGSISVFLAPVTANYLLEHYGYTGAAMIFGAVTLNQCVGAMLYQPVEWHMKPANTFSVDHKISKDIVNLSRDLNETDRKITVDTMSFEKTENKTTEYTNEVTLNNQNLMQKLMKVLKSTLNNLKTLKYMRVNFIAFSYLFFVVGFNNFLMYIPFVITSAGHSLEIASWISSLASVGSILGRVLMSVLADRKFFNVIYGLMFGLFTIGISVIGKLWNQNI